MIGLDTSAIIDLFKGDEKIKLFLEKNKEPLAVTMISYLELFFGLDTTHQKHVDEGNYYKSFFKDVYLFDLTTLSCEKASKLFWNLKKQGKEIEQFDCTIAGIFLTNGINKILTKNPKHFERITEARVIDYSRCY
jgi:predicted nucleic acid-binding protein